MDDAKESLDREVNLSKIKEEALAYKNSITQGVQNLTNELDLKKLDLDENILETTKSSTDPSPSSTKSLDSTHKDSTNSIKPSTKETTPLNFGENLNNPSKKG